MSNFTAAVINVCRTERYLIFSPGKFIKPRQQSLFCSFPNKYLAFMIIKKIHKSLFCLLLRFKANRYVFRISASFGLTIIPPRTNQALRIFRRTNHRPQIQNCRSIIRRMFLVGQRRRLLPNKLANFGSRFRQMV